MIGRKVGTYEIQEKLGEGGMGAVYKGVDRMLERTVAIKVLRPELAREPRVVERFRSEAITLARLNHPNVAMLYTFLREGDDFFMVMEYVPGETLEAVLKRGAMPVKQAISLFSQALSGIAHAHQLGIVHRDLKPANIMLTAEGAVKVMDFGIARMLGTARMTRTGHLIGTIEYMSPEQVRGQETDARSDIYSLGIVLYEMLTGRVPFEADSDFSLMQAQANQRPRPLRTWTPSVPAKVEKVVLKTLAKQPEARYQTVDAFREALEAGMPDATPVPAAPLPDLGNVLAPLRRFFASSDSSSERPKATRLGAGKPDSGQPAPIKATRLAATRETRIATDDESDALDSPPATRLFAARAAQIPWRQVAVIAPLVVILVIVLIWRLDGAPSKNHFAGADSTDVVADTTLLASDTGGSGWEFSGPPRQPSQPEVSLPEQFVGQQTPLQPAEEEGLSTVKPEKPARRKSETPKEEGQETTSKESEPPAPHLGSLRVLVRPFGDVYVNGTRKVEDTSQPYTEDLSPGTYRVRVVHPSFGSWEKQVRVEAGQARDMVFNFNAEYRLTITSNPPNAEILVDGQATGRYTPSVVTVRPGQHTIEVRKKGYKADGGSKRVLVERDRKEPTHFDLQEN